MPAEWVQPVVHQGVHLLDLKTVSHDGREDWYLRGTTGLCAWSKFEHERVLHSGEYVDVWKWEGASRVVIICQTFMISLNLETWDFMLYDIERPFGDVTSDNERLLHAKL